MIYTIFPGKFNGDVGLMIKSHFLPKLLRISKIRQKLPIATCLNSNTNFKNMPKLGPDFQKRSLNKSFREFSALQFGIKIKLLKRTVIELQSKMYA